MGNNKLIHEKSPYLLQHADNPVDWYPWGQEAFDKAATEDKPVFLSIGYSTCHWCHVMAHESFENPDVARLMNDAFISIKVDREERPDIDSIYMTACHMMTQSGGWPLTIIMTPDKRPFFAGTYIPKETRFGRMGMLELVPRIKIFWESRRDDILKLCDQVTASLQDINRLEPAAGLTESIMHSAYELLEASFDTGSGGFGSAPKFPTPHNLMFLLRYWKRTNRKKALQMVEETLTKMRCGGIYDHVGFGFHRYSTDPHWLVPHFEKMLYDQALLAMTYTEAYQATGIKDFRQTAHEIITYVLRDMTSPAGGFYCAEDADSEGEEGRFYLWRHNEITELLPADDADLSIKIWNISKEGNFEEEASGIQQERNILHLNKSFSVIADELGFSEKDLQKRLEQIRIKLFTHRKKRVHPHKDDKILTDWNGLMIAACAKAARVLNEEKFTEAALQSADFILKHLRSPEGRLIHRFRDGQSAIPALGDDYAFMIWGFIELYETTFQASHLRTALDLTRDFIKHFWDERHGGFFLSADDAENLLVRQKTIYDGAVPSGNSVAMLNLLRLARMTGNTDFEQKAEQIGRSFAKMVQQTPSAHTMLLTAFDFAIGPSFEVVISGDEYATDTKKMLHAFTKRFIPNSILLFRPIGKQHSAIDDVCAFTKHQNSIDGKATAYICRNFSCASPTTDIITMLKLLNEK